MVQPVYPKTLNSAPYYIHYKHYYRRHIKSPLTEIAKYHYH